jgi:hypothetical protein
MGLDNYYLYDGSFFAKIIGLVEVDVDLYLDGED